MLTHLSDLTNLAVDIPELDNNTPGLLRSRWFPMALSNRAIFNVIILTSASHYAATNGLDTGLVSRDLLHLRWRTIEAVKEAVGELESPRSSPGSEKPPPLEVGAEIGTSARHFGMKSCHTGPPIITAAEPHRDLIPPPELDTLDQVIAAVGKMASYEAMYGSPDLFHVHMNALLRMIYRRPEGLNALGLGGLLTRMVLWIDSNSSFLLGTKLYFDNVGAPIRWPLMKPDPAHFLGTC